ncbi:hypothetical protein HYC85_026229 [Camellia sinensis]|uniref:Uncharacterized protein n=1 Tax=Camellia sinensis TaxID=4442 RepID=A0A7J7G2Z6_CAMSI|nr:hypothetical protein HYC85_026229 [Camellia sinensis]
MEIPRHIKHSSKRENHRRITPPTPKPRNLDTSTTRSPHNIALHQSRASTTWPNTTLGFGKKMQKQGNRNRIKDNKTVSRTFKRRHKTQQNHKPMLTGTQ